MRCLGRSGVYLLEGYKGPMGFYFPQAMHALGYSSTVIGNQACSFQSSFLLL